MSGETEREVSGWTVDTLKELHDREIGADRRLGRACFAFVCVTVALGWNEIQRRLLTLNHAHEQHEATLAASVTSDKYDSDKGALDKRIGSLEQAQATARTREQAVSDEAIRSAQRSLLTRDEERTDGAFAATTSRQTIALLLSAVAIAVTIAVAAIVLVTRPSQGRPPATVTVTVPAR